MARQRQKKPKYVNVGVEPEINAILDGMVGPTEVKRRVLALMIRWFGGFDPAERRSLLAWVEPAVIDPGLELAYAGLLEEAAQRLRQRAATERRPDDFAERTPDTPDPGGGGGGVRKGGRRS